MRYLLILILCLASNNFLCFGQQSLINPISLGSILVDQSNVDKMVELCEAYNLSEVHSNDELKTFIYDDGTLIKFNIASDSTGCKKPYVEIQTDKSNKAIEKAIFDTGFYKEKDKYVKGYKFANRFTTCIIIGKRHKRVIFNKENGNISSY